MTLGTHRPLVDVLVPTCDRPAALAITLATLAAQDFREFRVVVSDQGDACAFDAGEVQAAVRVLRLRGHAVVLLQHLPRRGLAEQRHYLLQQAAAPYVLYLDDDVLLEPDVVRRLWQAMREEACGFVGMGLIGPSHAGDRRPQQERIEPWVGRVEPELVEPGSPAWERHHLHSAANLLHVQRHLGATPERPLHYRVAWVGGCVLYDRARLEAVGGFGFWRELPVAHCGEDVLAQLRVMARFGGCGLLPSGAYHQELPTRVPDRSCNAPERLPVVPPSSSHEAA